MTASLWHRLGSPLFIINSILRFFLLLFFCPEAHITICKSWKKSWHRAIEKRVLWFAYFEMDLRLRVSSNTRIKNKICGFLFLCRCKRRASLLVYSKFNGSFFFSSLILDAVKRCCQINRIEFADEAENGEMKKRPQSHVSSFLFECFDWYDAEHSITCVISI